MDAHRQARAGGRLPHLSPHAPPRALPSSRLHAPPPARLAAHAGLLPARVEPLSRAGGRERGRGALTDSPVPSIERRNSIRRVSPRVRTVFRVTGIFLSRRLTDRSRVVGQATDGARAEPKG